MKRFRDCSISCIDGQKVESLLALIAKTASEKGLRFKKYSSFSENDSLAVYVSYSNLPFSKIILCAEDDHVSIVNIIPMPESGTSQIDPHTYNKILEGFMEGVVNVIRNDYGNEVESNSEDFTIQDVIPRSFSKLDTWLHGYPLTSHPMDTHRWNEFVIALHTSKENLSLDVFGKYLEEKYGWDDGVILNFELKLEAQLNLLECYDEHK